MKPTPVGNATSLGQLLRRHRVAAGLSQEELAERCGVSARTVSDLERGQRSSARLETIRMLADGLHLTESDRADLLLRARPELAPSTSRGSGGPFLAPRTTTLPLRLQSPPSPLTDLIGRDDLVARTGQILTSSSVRLLTLIGPGGVGKTRLSQAVSHQIATSFADGVAFIDLSPLQSPYLVPGTIASGLGLSVDPDVPPLDSLRNVLRTRTLLLILDNFEHLLDAAPAVSTLLAACPGLKVLATSRARLQLRGEHLVHVHPLEVPERRAEQLSVLELTANSSVRLFLERAGDVDADFSLNEQNADAVAEICRRLDGLPLAIELAASRIGLDTADTLLEKLENRLPVLTGGPRDAPDRQRTLRDTIAWSYDLLGPAEQQVFRRLAVFSGGCTLGAAESVAASQGTDVPAVVGVLLASSLISSVHQPPEEQRFTMLDTVHEFASMILEQSGEAQSIQRRQADWCVGLARTAGDDLIECREESNWFRRLDAEQANTRAAIEFLLASGDGDSVVGLLAAPWAYWTERPYPRDLRRWLEPALAQSTDEFNHPTILALGLLINATSFLGELETATATASRQLQLAETIGTSHALGMSWFWQGITADFSGDVERAAVSFERALAFHRQSGHIFPILETMLEVGSISLSIGRLEHAVAILDESLVVARAAGSETELAYGLLYRGFAALGQADPGNAARYLQEGLRHSQHYHMDRVTLGATGGMAGVALALGQPDLAARLLGAVESARQSSGVGRICQAVQVDAIATKTLERLGQDAFDSGIREGGMTPYTEAMAAALTVAAMATGDAG